MNSTDIALAALAGAFAFHLWSEIKAIKTATGISTHVVSLDSILGLGDNEGDDKPEAHAFGFNPRSKKLGRRKHGNTSSYLRASSHQRDS